MIETSSIFETQIGLPEDLRDWVDESTLVNLVFEALHTAHADPADSMTKRGLPPGIPRTLWTLLTYSYAIGIYSSEEIERCILRDPQLQYLSVKTCPSGDDLRRFRRLNRPLLKRSLGRLLGAVWALRLGTIGLEATVEFRAQDHGLTHDSLAVLFESAAEYRINRAVLADTMALDI